MSAQDYWHLTYDLTRPWAKQLLPGNPRMVFEYISGEGTDANSQQRWAQGQSRSGGGALKMVPECLCAAAGFIQPMRSTLSRLRSLQWLYALTAPIYPFLQKSFGRWIIYGPGPVC